MTNRLADLKDKASSSIAISNSEAAELLELRDEQQIIDLMAITRAVSDLQMGRKINFYYTSHYFPAISVTGSECALRCKHCETKLLQNLTAALSPQKLVQICEKLASKGAKGVLVTGGCLINGKVPISGFLDSISLVKKKTNLIVIAHTGILNFEEAKKLVAAGLDGAAVDVVGLPQTTKAVYGIEIKPEDYAGTLRALEKAQMPIISPHVCVGLNFGNMEHELESLKIISGIKPTTVVITALMPLRGTPMEKAQVKPFDVVKVVAVARLMFPNVPITLGCARSKGAGRSLIEKLAIQAGITNVATPSDFAIKQAKSIGLTTACYAACCAVPPTPSLKLSSTEETEKVTLNQPVEKIRVSIGTAVILGLEMAFMNRDNAPTTAYLQTYYPGRCAANCKFCAQAKTSEAKVDKIARGLYLPYDAELVIARLKKAAERKFIKRICIQTMNYPNLMNELLWLVKRLNAEVAAPISVSIFSVPAEQIRRLKDSGVQKIIIPLDAANEKIFDDIKGAKAAGPYRWGSHLKTIHDAIEIMGKGNVGTHLMVGLGETELEVVNLLAKLNDEGVYCALFAFTPITGTRMAVSQPPSIESYRRIKLANYLVINNLTRAERMRFNESGEIVDFGTAQEDLEKTIAHGEPFLTSGCPDCNRPFANETPEKKIYNFPILPSKEELSEIKKQVHISKEPV